MPSSFSHRVQALPALGLGLSTEYGAMRAQGALDLFEARATLPHCAAFLELGVEVDKGLDEDALQWIDRGWPTTYHFLDVNLNEPEDLDSIWLSKLNTVIAEASPAWLCGDAGLWHFGPRAQGHMLLLPPILSVDSAYELADGIIALREATGFEVLPENPPGHLFVGDLHILDFFAIVCERADTGMLLDMAHLSIYQHSRDLSATTALESFPLDRVVEVHMAGGRLRSFEGYEVIEDDHNPQILAPTWAILHRCAPSLSELRAVVFECERNPLSACKHEMQGLYQTLKRALPSTSPIQRRLTALERV